MLGFRRASYKLATHARTLLTTSYVEGAKTPPLSNLTLPSFFNREILDKHAERSALVCRAERADVHGSLPPTKDILRWNFAQFSEHIQALARGLLVLGVKKGDRVGVIMGNNSAYATLQWACASIGAILVTINPAYRQKELVSVLSLVSVSHLFIVPRIRTTSYLDIFTSDLFAQSNEPPLPHLRNIIVFYPQGKHSEAEEPARAGYVGNVQVVDWREVPVRHSGSIQHREMADILEGLNNDEVINLQFTSGTTGAPKAVSLTHNNLLNNALPIGQAMRLTHSDIVCNVPPLFHCFGLILGNLAAWTHGACIVYPSPIFSPKDIVDAVELERATALHGVPTHFLGVLDEVEKRKKAGEVVRVSSLRTGIAAGSPIPIELMKHLISELGLTELTNAYGMTETSPVSFQTTTDDSLVARTETVGRVRPHVRAKLIDADGAVVPVGTPGEICVAGYLLQKGYWEDDKQTRAVMRPEKNADGTETLWMHTGDEGILDSEGYLKIVGRIKDIIIRGGENLFPVQIENALDACDGVAEAAAVAVPDAKYGETVGAWIVRNHWADKVSREDVWRSVAHTMNPQNAPAWVWFVGEDGTPDELPKTASGKVQKHLLREWSRELAKKGVGRVTAVFPKS